MNNLKEEFIKYFGEEKWEEEEILETLQEVAANVCNNWLGLEVVPIVFKEANYSEVAGFDVANKVIWLDKKHKNDIVELMNSVIHELEHYYQLVYVTNYNTSKALRWKKELDNYITSCNAFENLIQEIEMDAYAFAQIVLETEYGVIYRHKDSLIQELIDKLHTFKKNIKRRLKETDHFF